jgi:hypothetical protein
MTSYTNVFDGNPVGVSPRGYVNIALTGNRTISWPTQFQNTNSVVSNILAVTPTNNGFILTMPDATLTSDGQSFLLNNPTVFSFIMNKNDGTLLANISGPSFSLFYISDNTTVGGTWVQAPFGGGYTAVTQVAASSSTANIVIGGSPITTSGTLTFNVGADLAALTAFGAGTGFSTRTAANTWALRTLTGTANQIQLTNPAGIAGNPTFSLAANVSGITSLTAGNIKATANTISSTNLNGDINLAPNGTGLVGIRTGNSLAFYEPADTNYISLACGNLAANIPLTLPTTIPVAGQVLEATTPTQLGWANVTTFGGPSTVNAIAKYSNITGSLANSGVTIDGGNNIAGATSIIAGNIGIGSTDANTIVTTDANGDLLFSPNGSGEVRVTRPLVVRGGEELRLYNAGNGFYNSLSADAALGLNLGWTLPSLDGAANSMMKTNAAGALSFSSILDVYATSADLQQQLPPNTTHPVVPNTLQYHLGVAKAWVVFNGTTAVISNSYNVSGIVRNSAGNYTISFTTHFASTNYTSTVGLNAKGIGYTTTFNVGSAIVITEDSLFSASDFTVICVSFFGTQ